MGMRVFHTTGLMSGTSLDGLDIAHCEFRLEKDEWKYKLHYGNTFSYPESLINRLRTAHTLDLRSLAHLDRELATIWSEHLGSVLPSLPNIPELITSHGHTIFHQPESGITFQAGDPRIIAKRTGIPVVADLRRQDIELGGQGAPLVPVGDHLLFGDYDACLNLGGIANISLIQDGKRIAFDCCPLNQVFDALANRLGLSYDEDGRISASGTVNQTLLKELNGLDHYQKTGPRSLGREWTEGVFFPVLNAHASLSVPDLMATCSAHFAGVIATGLHAGIKKVLVTGGGAYHRDLMSKLQDASPVHWEKGSDDLIRYKEAIIFAFLGLLKKLEIPNVWASVTGARRDHVSGTLFLPD